MLSKFYSDCLRSVRRLRDMAQTSGSTGSQAFRDTAQSLEEVEVPELLMALTEHTKQHACITVSAASR